MFRRLLNDESGAVISFELVLISTILVIGAIVGLKSVRDAVVSELADAAQAAGNLDQSYSYSSVDGHASGSYGSRFVDGPDFCDPGGSSGPGSKCVNVALLPVPGEGGTDGGSTDGGSTDGGSTDGGSTDGGGTDGFTTFSQGGFGSPSNSTPGQILDDNFATDFPDGLTIGLPGQSATFDSAEAVRDFLPAGGTPAPLGAGDALNPTSTDAGNLAAQVVTMALNVGISALNAGGLGGLFIQSGPFAGMTVNQVLSIANQVLGGNSGTGFTPSQVNTAAEAINLNYHEGTTDAGFLGPAPP